MKAVALAFAVVVVTLGCKNPLESSKVPATFTLAPGQTARAENASVTFVEIASDSRCPANVVCIQAGDVVAVVTVSANALDGRYQLHLNDTTQKKVVHRGYTIELMDVKPLPLAGQPTPASSYRVTIEIR